VGVGVILSMAHSYSLVGLRSGLPGLRRRLELELETFLCLERIEGLN
jgi:hypothetical protein